MKGPLISGHFDLALSIASGKDVRSHKHLDEGSRELTDKSDKKN